MLQKIIIVIAILIIGFSVGKWLTEQKNQQPTITINKAQPSDNKGILGDKSLDVSGPFSYAAAVKKVAPSVVNIHTKTLIKQKRSFFNDPIFDLLFGGRFNPMPRERLQTSLGSGVIVSKDGYILTNNHVIKNADTILIGLNDGRNTTARFIGADIDTDLAILKIEIPDLNPIEFADSDKVEVGDVTLAIGNPFGVGQTVTSGIVSATGRSELGITNLENFIQTDAAINPGNSGGALANARGELIGVNIAIYSKSGASHGIGFAVPANVAQKVIEKIAENGQVRYGWLGVETQDFTKELAHSFGVDMDSGVIVSGVYANGPAKLTGIKPGDILTHLNGNHISSSKSWKQMALNLNPGDKAQIDLLRQGQKHRVTLEVSIRPSGLK